MGNNPSAAPAPADSLTTINSIPTTKPTTPITYSIATKPTTPITYSIATKPTTPITSSSSVSNNTNDAPTTTVVTTTTTAPTTATTTTAVTSTTPTPTITSTTPAIKDTSTTPILTEGNSKPTFYSVAKALTSDADKEKSASSAYAHWYKWSKFEQQQRDKGKTLWYMGPPVTTTDTPSRTTSTLTMTTAKIGDDRREATDISNIAAIPSYQLRSTAVYSPPHGDRFLSGRNELINTDTSVFKYYLPENRSEKTGGIHTKAAMYRMNTLSKQTPLPTQSIPFTSNDGTNVTRNNSSLPTFVPHDLQTEFQAQPPNSSYTQGHFYQKQQPQIVPASAFSNNNSSHNGFYHLASKDTNSEPVFPPIEKTPVQFNDQPRPSALQSFPSYLPPPPPPPRTSILKKSSTVLSQDISNPLSEQTPEKVLEELRKHNKNTKDGTYRIKKVHLLEKNDLENHPPTVSFNLPPPPPPPKTKASQSILRSERLFFSQLFNRKK